MSFIVASINVITAIGAAALLAMVGSLVVIIITAIREHTSIFDVKWKYYRPILITVPIVMFAIIAFILVLNI